MKKIGVAVLACGAAALLSMSACDRVGHKDRDRGDLAGRLASKAERKAARMGERYGADRDDRGGGAASTAATYRDGKPIWASNRKRTAEENIQKMFQRNGEDFGASSADDYVAKAHAFLANPPHGVQTATRKNGDKLYYDAKTNTFAVATRDGAPRIMMKPRDGASYWQEQLANLDRKGYGQGKSRRGGGFERADRGGGSDDNG